MKKGSAIQSIGQKYIFSFRWSDSLSGSGVSFLLSHVDDQDTSAGTGQSRRTKQQVRHFDWLNYASCCMMLHETFSWRSHSYVLFCINIVKRFLCYFELLHVISRYVNDILMEKWQWRGEIINFSIYQIGG